MLPAIWLPFPVTRLIDATIKTMIMEGFLNYHDYFMIDAVYFGFCCDIVSLSDFLVVHVGTKVVWNLVC